MAGELTSEQFIQIVNNLGSPDENMINKAVDQAIENKQLAPKSYADMKIAEAIAKLQQGGTPPSKPNGPGEQPPSQPPAKEKKDTLSKVDAYEGAETGRVFHVVGDTIAMDLWENGLDKELKKLGKVKYYFSRSLSTIISLFDYLSFMTSGENAEVIMFAGNTVEAGGKMSEHLKNYNPLTRFTHGYTLFTTPPVHSEEAKTYVDAVVLKDYVKGEKVKFSSVVTETICGEVGLSNAGYAYGMVGSSTREKLEFGCIPESEPTLINKDGTLKEAVAKETVSEVIKVIK